MSIFEKIFGLNNKKKEADDVLSSGLNDNKTAPTQTKSNNKNLSLNLSKEESLLQLNLRKDKLLSLCLDKKEFSRVARVALVLDYSGSMERMYRNGEVQAVIERLLPVAMNLDDNGEMEMWLFDDSYNRINSISIKNYYNYIKNENILNKYPMGCTKYSPVMKDIRNKYLKEEPLDNVPTLVLFITDGDTFDSNETIKVLRECSDKPIFWQFIGLGNTRFKFLETLDNLDDRFVDNANFFSINDFKTISDDELYKRLLKEYPSWLNEIIQKGMIK